jgi:hypothetical protein
VVQQVIPDEWSELLQKETAGEGDRLAVGESPALPCGALPFVLR